MCNYKYLNMFLSLKILVMMFSKPNNFEKQLCLVHIIFIVNLTKKSINNRVELICLHMKYIIYFFISINKMLI